MTTPTTPDAPDLGRALPRLYLARAVVAVLWAAVLLATDPGTGPLLTVLLVVYPLIDAAAVLRQLRAERGARLPAATQRVNVAISVAVAVLLGWASTVSVGTVLTVWGLWAVGAGIPQLLTAVRNRHLGGQVPQMLSGGISVLAGLGFLGQGVQGGGTLAGIAGYATLGGIFFLVSAIRLGALRRGARG